MNFADQLAEKIREKRTPLVVGLDPRLELLPGSILESVDRQDLRSVAEALQRFCRGVLEVVAPLVPAVKIQAAFFERWGPPAMQVLASTIREAQEAGLLVILDGKRNDIGSTAAAYAEAYLGRHQSVWGADALTVNPYLGDDSLEPFIKVALDRSAGVFVLVKTSNSGGKLFQDLLADGQPVFVHVARLVEQMNGSHLGVSGYGPIGAVVGATYPEQLAHLRRLVPHAWFLVPGFGAQGATAQDVAAAFDQKGLGAIINSSRAIIFAYRNERFAKQYTEHDWQQAVRAATYEAIEQLRLATPAKHL